MIIENVEKKKKENPGHNLLEFGTLKSFSVGLIRHKQDET